MVDSIQSEESPTLNHMSYKVSTKRHLGKTISYRIISTLLGFLIMWFATGSIKIGAAFGVAELLIKPVLYYLHERIWYRYVKFGLIEEKKPKVKKVQINEEPLDVISKEPTQIPQSTGKKVLSYSSNR
jgi:uncharacterized membrane protein